MPNKKVVSITLRSQEDRAKRKHIFKAEQEKRLLMLFCRPGNTLHINACPSLFEYELLRL